LNLGIGYSMDNTIIILPIANFTMGWVMGSRIVKFSIKKIPCGKYFFYIRIAFILLRAAFKRSSSDFFTRTQFEETKIEPPYVS
jgi:hypothetical protein